MIVTTGKTIHIKSGKFLFERNSDMPNIVKVKNIDGSAILSLSASDDEIKRFCEAYLRCAQEDVGYRKEENEF
jgi:hypothetical protein